MVKMTGRAFRIQNIVHFIIDICTFSEKYNSTCKKVIFMAGLDVQQNFMSMKCIFIILTLFDCQRW